MDHLLDMKIVKLCLAVLGLILVLSGLIAACVGWYFSRIDWFPESVSFLNTPFWNLAIIGCIFGPPTILLIAEGNVVGRLLLHSVFRPSLGVLMIAAVGWLAYFIVESLASLGGSSIAETLIRVAVYGLLAFGFGLAYYRIFLKPQKEALASGNRV